MRDGHYWPSLDGVRAVAIAAVVAYHFGHLGGGWLGVDLLFALSGFLITSQLLELRGRPVAAALRGFWARRARRLLPALLVVVCAVALYAWAGGPGLVGAQLRAPALATLLSGAALLAGCLAAITTAALASYYVVEQPLRRAAWAAWGRRALVPAALAGAAALVLVATVAPVAASTTKVPVLTRATQSVPGLTAVLGSVPGASPSHPVRIWMFGDSVLNDASPGVTAALQATGDAQVVANTTFPGWSFVHDPTWRSEWEQVIAQDKPEVVIATWSWDDQLAEDHPARYLAQLRSALDVIMTPGDGVDLLVLLQFPQGGPPSSPTPGGAAVVDRKAVWAAETKAQDAWDAVARKALKAYPGHALYLPTSSLFAPHGRYLAWFRTPSGGWLRARKIDNVHFCPYGAAVFGAYLVERLGPVLHLGSLSPGWENGAWTLDPRYDDPPGACPDDQPPAGYSGSAVPS